MRTNLAQTAQRQTTWLITVLVAAAVNATLPPCGNPATLTGPRAHSRI